MPHEKVVNQKSKVCHTEDGCLAISFEKSINLKPADALALIVCVDRVIEFIGKDADELSTELAKWRVKLINANNRAMQGNLAL